MIIMTIESMMIMFISLIIKNEEEVSCGALQHYHLLTKFECRYSTSHLIKSISKLNFKLNIYNLKHIDAMPFGC